MNKNKRFKKIKTIIIILIIIFSIFLLLYHFKTLFFKDENFMENDKWTSFISTEDHFRILFPTIPQKIGDEEMLQYISKDEYGNLYAIQHFIPGDDLIKNQNSKEILQTAIKILVLKDNVKLTDTTYAEYNGQIVAVDFLGVIIQENSPFKGKIILEDKSLYYLYFVSKNNNSENLENYNKFIQSFQLEN